MGVGVGVGVGVGIGVGVGVGVDVGLGVDVRAIVVLIVVTVAVFVVPCSSERAFRPVEQADKSRTIESIRIRKLVIRVLWTGVFTLFCNDCTDCNEPFCDFLFG